MKFIGWISEFVLIKLPKRFNKIHNIFFISLKKYDRHYFRNRGNEMPEKFQLPVVWVLGK